MVYKECGHQTTCLTLAVSVKIAQYFTMEAVQHLTFAVWNYFTYIYCCIEGF